MRINYQSVAPKIRFGKPNGPEKKTLNRREFIAGTTAAFGTGLIVDSTLPQVIKKNRPVSLLTNILLPFGVAATSFKLKQTSQIDDD